VHFVWKVPRQKNFALQRKLWICSSSFPAIAVRRGQIRLFAFIDMDGQWGFVNTSDSRSAKNLERPRKQGRNRKTAALRNVAGRHHSGESLLSPCIRLESKGICFRHVLRILCTRSQPWNPLMRQQTESKWETSVSAHAVFSAVEDDRSPK